MMGQEQRPQEQLLYTSFSLDERIGADNRLRRIRDAVDFSFVRPAVADLYGDVGNPSADPVVLLKLMLISFLENVFGERELMRPRPIGQQAHEPAAPPAARSPQYGLTRPGGPDR